MRNTPIIALDFATGDAAIEFLDRFSEPLFVKVGMELYLQHGPPVVRALKDRGHSVFLDLKLHDIPNTVAAALRGLGRLDIDMVNVHAAGGVQMMSAGLQALREVNERAKLIAVTQLTSTGTQQMRAEQQIPLTVGESVLHYAKKAAEAGLAGVVCAASEAASVATDLGADFLKVTPGVRLESDAVHDQKRVTTPEGARRLGATHIVVGRSITGHKDPVARYREILERWQESL